MKDAEDYSYKVESYDPEHLTVKGDRSLVWDIVIKKLVPFIQLFGLYVLAFGELGAGGGFQGGVILGASIIALILVDGLDDMKKRIKYDTVKTVLPSVGVMIYGGIGVLCILAGGNYLQYGVLPFGSPAQSSNLGILGIETGVEVTVAAVMITLFCEVVKRGE